MLTLPRYDNFKEILTARESGNYKQTAPALGAYQFTYQRILDISRRKKLSVPTVQEFLNNPGLQDVYFALHVSLILKYIEDNNLDQFVGKLITGKNKHKLTTKINLYGLVAGAHLGGEYGLKNFLLKGKDVKDSLGTYISDYIAYFSDKMKNVVENVNIATVPILILSGLILGIKI